MSAEKSSKELKALLKESESVEKEQQALIHKIEERQLEANFLEAVIEKAEKEYEAIHHPDLVKTPLKGLETLIEVYRYTLYKVDGLESAIKIGQRHPEIDALLELPNISARTKAALAHELYSWAYLTAANPMSKALPESENRRRNALFQKDLLEYQIIPGAGHDPKGEWTPEASFLILGIGLRMAKVFARKYQQRAFLFGSVGKPCQMYIRAVDGTPFYTVG